MDCESCGRYRPSGQVFTARSATGAVVMVCGRCRRHVMGRPGTAGGVHEEGAAVRPTVAGLSAAALGA